MFTLVYHMIQKMPDGYRARIAWRDGDQCGADYSETVPSRDQARELMAELEGRVKREHPSTYEVDKTQIFLKAVIQDRPN